MRLYIIFQARKFNPNGFKALPMPLQQAAPPLADALKSAAATQHPRTDADWGLVLDLADPAAAK